MNVLTCAAVALAGLLSCQAAEAAYTVTISEKGGDVVAHGTGTLNLRGLVRNASYDTSGGPFIEPEEATLWTGFGDAKFYDVSFSGPATGWSSAFSGVDGAGSGDVVYFNVSGLLGVSSSYFSGSLLNSTADFANQNFASLELIPGTYVYAVGSGVNRDTFTVQIGPAPEPTVPEASSWAMMIVGMGAIGFAMRCRKVATRIPYVG